MLRTILLVLPMFALLGVAIYYVAVGWTIGEATHVGAAGYIAMALGIVATLAVAGVLITLLLWRGSGDR
ncbi:MAG TPA: hypothetical protein VFW75_13465 [Acetobacteraceae bacterium]|nr:hypothetical protein [Acetobacteraceae bacterium]